jgi:predicted secreted protein
MQFFKEASIMRELIVRLVTAGAVCIALAAGAVDPARATELNYNLVEFSVQARRDVNNDLMQATLFAEATGSDSGELAALVNKRLAAAVAQAKAVQGVKVESGNYQSWANYQKGKQDGWRTRAELRLESRDFTVLAGLIGRLQSSDLQLGGLQFSVSPALRTQVEGELTKEALAAFQNRADVIRQSLSAQASKIVTIRIDTQTPQIHRPMMRAKAMASLEEAAAPAAEAGNSEIIVSAIGTVQTQ